MTIYYLPVIDQQRKNVEAALAAIKSWAVSSGSDIRAHGCQIIDDKGSPVLFAKNNEELTAVQSALLMLRKQRLTKAARGGAFGLTYFPTAPDLNAMLAYKPSKIICPKPVHEDGDRVDFVLSEMESNEGVVSVLV